MFFFYSSFSQKEKIISFQGKEYRVFTSLGDVENINPDSVLGLAIRYEKFNDFPIEIIKFKNIRFIDLNPCDQSEANKMGILSLKQKQIYDSLNIVYKNRGWDGPMHKNKIKHIPKEISQLTKLETINIYSVEIKRREVKRLTKLLPNTYIYFPGFENIRPNTRRNYH